MSAADRLDEIEARANAATAGPWSWAQWYDGLSLGAKERAGVDATLFQHIEPVLGTGHDTEFIAAARQDVPALVAALRAVLDIPRSQDPAAAPYIEDQLYREGRNDVLDQVIEAIEGALS
jgi:hypothetical protein